MTPWALEDGETQYSACSIWGLPLNCLIALGPLGLWGEMGEAAGEESGWQGRRNPLFSASEMRKVSGSHQVISQHGWLSNSHLTSIKISGRAQLWLEAILTPPPPLPCTASVNFKDFMREGGRNGEEQHKTLLLDTCATLTDFNRKSHRRKCAPLRAEYYVKKILFI